MLEAFKPYFWKRFWFVFGPLYVIAISNESHIAGNSFADAGDYGTFLLFLALHFVGYGAATAGILHLFWRASLNRGGWSLEEKVRE